MDVRMDFDSEKASLREEITALKSEMVSVKEQLAKVIQSNGGIQ